MDIILKVNDQTNGRDKLARLVQYTSRLVWHQLELRNANKYSVDRVQNLESTLSTFRKILRFGRCIDVLYTVVNNVHHEDPWLRLTITVSKIAYGLYLYADHVVWLIRSGFLRSDSNKWNKTANKFWLVSIIANLAHNFYEILHILEVGKKSFLRPSDLLKNSVVHRDCYSCLKHLYFVLKCHREVLIDTVRDSCNLFIPLTALGYTKFSPSTTGILGAVSSLASLITIMKNVCDSREKV